MLAQIMRMHKEDVARLEAENADLRYRLELAEQSTVACCALMNKPPELNNRNVKATEKGSNFPGWGAVLSGDVVRVRAIAEGESLTLAVHVAVLQRSPYFEVRLASRWSECTTGSALPLQLPIGCPVSAALLLFQHLYSDDLGSFGLSIAVNDAVTATAVAQLAGMLLFDNLQSDLSNLACSLLHSPDEAAELQRRFVTLPGAVAAMCRGARDVPAVSMAANDLARMLQGTARCASARAKAEAVLAAHGRTSACVEAVVAALEAMPFRVGAAHRKQPAAQIDREAFGWLWDLVERYVLVPGSGTSLLSFFRQMAGFQEVHSSCVCPAPSQVFDETASPLRTAFGTYLHHLAGARSEELCEAFRLGVLPECRPEATHRSQNCRINYPNVLHFGAWSRTLLPRLLRAAGPLQTKLQVELMNLPPVTLAGLVDDSLLQALGGDMAAVCGHIAEDSPVLMQWVTKKRLLAVPLGARRNLCISLAPSLGALPQDIGAVVVQVMAGGASKEEHCSAWRAAAKGWSWPTWVALCLVALCIALMHHVCTGQAGLL